MSIETDYLLVDDDAFNNKICSMAIKSVVPGAKIRAFTDPQEALVFLESDYAESQGASVLFLDINMPALTGWEFLEQFEKLSHEITSRISIYMLSSSVDPLDKANAAIKKSIKGFISKPLERNSVRSILDSIG